MQALSNELLIPLCIEQKKQPSKLTNEKDEFNETGHRRSETGKEREKQKYPSLRRLQDYVKRESFLF